MLRVSAAVSCAATLVACGGGSSDGGSGNLNPSSPTFDLQTGVGTMVSKGLSANVSLSGSVTSNGQTAQFTGTGTYTVAAGVSGTFNNTAALGQAESIVGTVTVANQTQSVNVNVTNYYATSSNSYSFLGEVEPTEYDVAQAAFQWPTSVQAGTSGMSLGTVLRYTDNTQSQSLGTSKVTYSVTAGSTSTAPLGIQLITNIYDASNNLLETDTRQYTLSSASVLTFVSYSTQSSQGTITATAQ